MGSSQPYSKKTPKKKQKALLKQYPLSDPKNALIALGVLLGLWFLLGSLFASEEGEKKQTTQKVAQVTIIESTAQERGIYITLQGHLEALNKVTLRAEADGLVKNITAEKGATLLQGADILNLSFESRLARLREAQALVAQRTLEYKNARKLQSNKFRTKIDVADAKSKLEAAQSVLEATQSDLEDTKVRAPFDGRVDTRHVQLGDYVKAGDPLVDFISLNPLIGVVFVSERDINRVKLNETAKIVCQKGSFEGTVSFISTIADPNTRTYRVEIAIDNSARALPDGITAAIKVPLGQEVTHLVSPGAIAIDDAGQPGLKILDEGNRVYFHPINILNHDTQGIWVTGLPEKARIITAGQYFVRVGDKVKAVLEKGLQQKSDADVFDQRRD